MSAANIQARIKNGLKRAVEKTGSTNSETVYLVKEVEVGGNDPLNPPTVIKSDIELVDAVFTQYDTRFIADSEIQAGDRRLVTNNDVELKQGDTIKQGSILYYIVNVDIKAPTSDALAYISQVRLK